MENFTEEQIRQIIRDELEQFIKSDRFIFYKTMQILDGRNIICGKSNGTKFGTEGGASGQKLGFFNATPVVQQAALTAGLTSITHTEPSTPDYAIQDLIQNTGFGFVTKDEGNSVLKVVLNLQTKVQELETKLESLGLIASN